MYDKYVSSFLKQKRWKYLREMYTESAPTKTSGFLQISSSIANVKHIFVYLKTIVNDKTTDNPYNMDTFKLNAGNNASNLTTCRLDYGNGVFILKQNMIVIQKLEYIMI